MNDNTYALDDIDHPLDMLTILDGQQPKDLLLHPHHHHRNNNNESSSRHHDCIDCIDNMEIEGEEEKSYHSANSPIATSACNNIILSTCPNSASEQDIGNKVARKNGQGSSDELADHMNISGMNMSNHAIEPTLLRTHHTAMNEQ